MGSATKIAVLDDYQNLSSKAFSSLDSAKFDITTFHDTLLPYSHPSTPSSIRNELVDRLKPFAVICSMRERTPFPRALLQQLPNLQLLLTTGMRNASIDLGACKELGIRVAGATGESGKSKSESETGAAAPPAGPDSTTQHTVALVLALARNLADDDRAMKTGLWQTSINTGLTGKTFGTVGFGRLGLSVAKIMYLAFGMPILAWSTTLTQETCDERAAAAGLPAGAVRCVGKDTLFAAADVLSVHYVLSERSRGIVGRSDLARMKPTAFLINTSRGPVVDDAALLDVLEAGRIRGAAIDVFEIEPLPKESAWRSEKWGKDGRSHVLLTPHMGYVEYEGMEGWYADNVENIERWRKGEDLKHVLA